ncbi:MAG: DNA-binding MarR family transcriptional regulator [Myxococcota bacterium]
MKSKLSSPLGQIYRNPTMTPNNLETPSKLNKTQLDNLSRVYKAVELLDALDPHITVIQMHILLIVGKSPDITITEVADILGRTLGAVSRNIGILTTRGDRDRVGLGLIERREDYHDRRVRLVRLSPKGNRLMARIVN